MSSIYIALHSISFYLLSQRNFDKPSLQYFILAVFNTLADFILAVFIPWLADVLHIALLASKIFPKIFQNSLQISFQNFLLLDASIRMNESYDWSIDYELRTSRTNISCTLFHWLRCSRLLALPVSWHCLTLCFSLPYNKHFLTGYQTPTRLYNFPIVSLGCALLLHPGFPHPGGNTYQCMSFIL